MAAVIQAKPLPRGTAEYETKRAALDDELASSIPQEYHLPATLIENPPLDVTSIPGTCGILTQEDLNITENYDAYALAEAISKKQLSAVQVVTAFCKRAAIAHQLSCCLTDFFMDEAIERAKCLDDYLEKHGKTIGPLHGVPVSIKEFIPLKGRPKTWGFLVTRAVDEGDSLMVKILRDAGAVFYVKTNMPQSVLGMECVSHRGRTLLPYNINLSSGGSSGGEAALIALRGGIFGMGTDIGGSIRAPAGFCNIYGFKPTAYILPLKDFVPFGFPAALNVPICVGPMGVSLRDADLFVRVVKAAQPHLADPVVLPFPWTGLGTQPPLPLKIGIMMHDGHVVPQPPVLKAMQWAEKCLATVREVEIKPYTAYRVNEAMALWHKNILPDAGHTIKELTAAGGEPVQPLLNTIIEAAGIDRELSASEIGDIRAARDRFRSEFSLDLIRQDVDYVLCPVFVGPAPAHETGVSFDYTALWNVVDYPGIVFPTPIKASKEKEQYPPEYATPLSKEDEHVRQLWQETNFEGAPIGLQLVARKHHDNELMGAMSIIKDALHLS